METLQFLGNLFCRFMWFKSETDYWDSRTDSFRLNVWTQIVVGLMLVVVGVGVYMWLPENSGYRLLPLLAIFDYCFVCLAYNSFCELGSNSFMSENFSEFWKFGFFKGDDFLAGIIVGAVGVVFCTSYMVKVAKNPQAFATKPVVTSAPVPASHYTSKAAHKMSPASHKPKLPAHKNVSVHVQSAQRAHNPSL